MQRRDTGERLGVLDLKTGGIIGDEYPVKSIEDVEMISVPTVEEFVASEEFTLFREVCGWAGDFNKVGGISMALSHLVAARGAEQAMFDLYEEPELVEALLNKQLRIAVNRAKAMVSCGMDTLYIGDPWSSCSVISPQIFAQYSFPFFRRFVEELKPSGLTIYAHICGNVNPIIGQIVDTGVDCIEPMDPLGGVSPAEFRKRVDRRVALMGGVNTVTLSSGTPDDVRTEALACIEAAGKNGGYILAAGDMVPFEAPRENVLAMYEAAQSYRD